MSLTRFYPTPSDRMGILWTLLSIKDAVILEYSPMGTTSYLKKAYGAMKIDIDNRIFPTGMTKDDVVMGDTSLLENEIVRLDKEMNPSVIFVMASTVSSVIGADVKGVCTCIQDDVSAKIIVFTQGGFTADFSSGRKIAYTKLVQELSVDKFDITDTYNILGISEVVHSSLDDIENICEMMSENFHLKSNAILSYDTTIEKIKSLSKAKINLVLSYEALEAAEILKKRFGTPYIYKFPIGNDGQWLNLISNELGLENKDSDKLFERPRLENVKAVIYASFDRAMALNDYLASLGVQVINIVSTHKLNAIKDKPKKVVYFKSESLVLEYFKTLEDCLVFGDSIISTNISASNTHINIENVFLDTAETELILTCKEVERIIIQLTVNV